jgi:hypothetical protein
MNQFTQSHNPQNLVANIVRNKIYFKNTSIQMTEAIKETGASQMTFGTELVWVIECIDKEVAIKTLQKLNGLGFLFVGGNSGYSVVDIFAFLLEEKKLNDKFKEVWWHGPGDWFIVEM